MGSERGLSTTRAQHCLEWYKLALRSRLFTPAMQYLVKKFLQYRKFAVSWVNSPESCLFSRASASLRSCSSPTDTRSLASSACIRCASLCATCSSLFSSSTRRCKSTFRVSACFRRFASSFRFAFAYHHHHHHLFTNMQVDLHLKIINNTAGKRLKTALS